LHADRVIERRTDIHDRVNSRLYNYVKSPNKNSMFLIIVIIIVTCYLKLRKITKTMVSSVINVAIIKEDFRIQRCKLTKILRFIYSS
jgi:hypothetical protein